MCASNIVHGYLYFFANVLFFRFDDLAHGSKSYSFSGKIWLTALILPLRKNQNSCWNDSISWAGIFDVDFISDFLPCDCKLL